ncbi:MAG: DUF3105 domain-containing protein [Actinomycetales bacterium]|nr:DUF3105 domain-containing protein [Actinomycetales bacterium]
MPKKKADGRAAELARIRAAQAAAERRRRIVITSSVVVVVVGLIAVAGGIILQASRHNAAVQAAAASPIPGVETETGLPAQHVTALPEPTPSTSGGTLLPPMGGDHDPVPQNCGVYTAPVATSNAVHSLEHGAVWITYQPGLEASQVATLTTLAQGNGYILLSPFADLRAPIVLTAWGVQLEVADASDPRVEEFLVKYVQGPQTPEPGAPCSGGVGTPA